MNTIAEYLDTFKDETQKQRMKEVLEFTQSAFPQLKSRIAWSTPHFTHEDTFILAFSAAKEHLAVSPEYKCLKQFAERFDQAGLKYTAMIVRFPWKKDMDYELLRDMIAYNLKDKKGCKTYWRPKEDWV